MNEIKYQGVSFIVDKETYEEYKKNRQEYILDLLNERNDLFKQLQSYKQKEDKLREYITSYESISTIQGLDNVVKNKGLDENTMIEMTNRYLEVHDKLLQILNEGDKQ